MPKRSRSKEVASPQVHLHEGRRITGGKGGSSWEKRMRHENGGRAETLTLTLTLTLTPTLTLTLTLT